MAYTLVSNIIQDKSTLDTMVLCHCSFIDDLLSLPTFNKYWVPLVFDHPTSSEFRPINFKHMFSSYYFSKRADDHEESKEETKNGEGAGMVMGELQKNEHKMFIFANTFEIMHTRLLE